MRTTFVIFCALLLTVPVATANWNYRGNNEPDTKYDTATWMFPGSDTSPTGNSIYFNGFARIARETHYNPNVAALGSRVQPVVTAMAGVLGFWKDCNNDGYIGNVEQSFLEYKSQLLLNDNICKPQTPADGGIWDGYLYPHNDGTWIRELIWIGPKKEGIGAAGQNPTNFYADGTGVWADWGTPGALPTLVCPGGNVGIRSTGAVVDAVDCLTYYRGVAALNSAEASTGLPVGGWDNHDVDNSPSPLNVQNPVYPFLYGPAEPDGHRDEGDFRGHSGGFLGRDTDNSNRRERLVTVVDCDSDSVSSNPSANTNFDAADPTSYPSAYESLNDTFEVATQNERDGVGPCDPSGPADEGAPYPSVEGYSEPTLADAGRVEVDFPAEFSVGNRNQVRANGGMCFASEFGPNAGKMSFRPDPVLGYCPPADGGTAVERDDFAIGPAWRTNAQVNTYGTTTREGLKSGNADMGAFYYTFYARLGDAALSKGLRPSSAVGVYGSEACGSFTTGVHNGWNCDPAAWVERCENPQLPTLPEQCYRVGFNYHLRDVDCWDGTLARGSGVRASLADFSQTGPCEPHPGNEDVDLTFT